MAKMDKKERRFWELFHGFKNAKAIPESIDRLFYKEMDIYDEHLGYIAKRIKLVDRLDLDDTCISNQGLMELTKLEALKELRLKSIDDITDESIAILTQIKGLEFLHLGGTNVTINGAKGLADAPDLRRIILNKRDATDKEVDELKAALPNCDVAVNP